ncbi:MAG: N-acetyltransferase [Nevskiaceae bacterium]|nr:MAG: N-acetyltransferase [Nevskiaceae bacterium]
MPPNTGSRRVLEKLGFQQEGLLRQRVRKWGRFEDVLIWSRLRLSGADDPDVPDLHGQR